MGQPRRYHREGRAHRNPPRPRGATASRPTGYTARKEPTAPAWGNRIERVAPRQSRGTHRARVGQPRSFFRAVYKRWNPPRPRGATPPCSSMSMAASEPTAPAWGNPHAIPPSGFVARTHRARVGQPGNPMRHAATVPNPPRPRGATPPSFVPAANKKEPTAPVWSNQDQIDPGQEFLGTHRARVGQPGWCGAGHAVPENPPRPRGATRMVRCWACGAREPTAPAWGNQYGAVLGMRCPRTHRARVGQPSWDSSATAAVVNPPRPRGATERRMMSAAVFGEPTAPAWGNLQQYRHTPAGVGTHRARVGQPHQHRGMTIAPGNPPRPRGANILGRLAYIAQ